MEVRSRGRTRMGEPRRLATDAGPKSLCSALAGAPGLQAPEPGVQASSQQSPACRVSGPLPAWEMHSCYSPARRAQGRPRGPGCSWRISAHSPTVHPRRPSPPPPLAFGALNVSSRSPGDRRGARGPFGVAGAALLPPSACNDLWSQQRHRGQAAVPTPRPFSHPLTRCLPLWNNVAHCSVVKPPEQGGSRRAGGAGQRTRVLCAGCTATCLGCQPLGSSSEAPKMGLPLAPRAGSPVGADSGPISDGHPGRSPRCGQLRWPSWCPQRRPETGTGPD